MKRKRIVVFGAGGHAKVVLDILDRMGVYEVVGLLDDNAELVDTIRNGYHVLGGQEKLSSLFHDGIEQMIVALGDNQQRKRVYDAAKRLGFTFCSAIHPSAQVGSNVLIGEGALLVAGVVVNVDACIGDNVIVNTGTSVDHDCRIEAHVHLSPGVHLAGRVTVGESTHVGIGAVILPSVVVGKNCIVGAGSVVREHVPSGMIVAGNPAKIIRPNEVALGA